MSVYLKTVTKIKPFLQKDVGNYAKISI